ncbi:12-oxophytodienoate reductase [Sphingobium sp.]|uniref:oxidoreductase n=1 Tax=Sphingobium sp. TaxID=1912891 RepID=UPI002C2F204D|nr:12-oxophytodienoate reductase [Sphingobium sp.]HUD90649.1 12-oxophytodienoate reductase [Sphingobium sp.]
MTAELTSPLFTPLTVRGVTVPNRTVMAPMGRQFAQAHVPHPDAPAYYRRRIEGGVGLVITEATGVDHPLSADNGGTPYMHGEAALAGWAAVVEAVHAAGGLIFPQLFHQGMLHGGGTPDEAVDSLRPSGTIGTPGATSFATHYIERARLPTRPMTEEEIADAIAAYARSVRNAVTLGFDGIALHGAHGYLIDGFLWGASNQRTDRWGGDVAQRTAFAVEVIKAVRAEMPEHMPLVFRFSQHKSSNYDARTTESPQELERMLGPIVDAGVDLLDASIRRFWQPAYEGSLMNLAGWAKKVTGKPVIAVGSVGLGFTASDTFMKTGSEQADDNIALLMERFNAGEFDMIAIGRSLISDPDYVGKLRRGEAPTRFSRDHLSTLV